MAWILNHALNTKILINPIELQKLREECRKYFRSYAEPLIADDRTVFGMYPIIIDTFGENEEDFETYLLNKEKYYKELRESLPNVNTFYKRCLSTIYQHYFNGAADKEECTIRKVDEPRITEMNICFEYLALKYFYPKATDEPMFKNYFENKKTIFGKDMMDGYRDSEIRYDLERIELAQFNELFNDIQFKFSYAEYFLASLFENILLLNENHYKDLVEFMKKQPDPSDRLKEFLKHLKL